MTGSKLAKPQRILMTADTVGGVWTYALELARALQPHGVNVALATMGRRLSPEQSKQAGSIDTLEVFESTFKLEWMEDPWADVAKAGDWLLGLEARLKPDVIHLNGYTHAALPWRAPTILVGHSCVLSWWRAVYQERAPREWNVYRENVRAGLQAADLVVTPSRTMLKALRQHYGPLPNSSVIFNGRALPLLTARPKEKFVLSVGRLWDEAKNVDALAAIASNLPWPVYLAGENRKPEGEPLPLRGAECLGQLSEHKLLPWFARASIYALPARYEPFGLSVLEAALCGCALVLGDIPSLRELWRNAALFVPPGDPNILKDALTELISSPAWIATLGAKARWAARSYTPDRMAQEYFSAYSVAFQQSARHELCVTAPGRLARSRMIRRIGAHPVPSRGSRRARTAHSASSLEKLAA